jgi:SAM-dependent methyltransferase
MSQVLPQQTGRSIFGLNAAGYEKARPGYPAWVFDELKQRGLFAGATLLEIGPGTGQATRELLKTEPRKLVACEPDSRLAQGLRENCPIPDRLEVQVCPFEQAQILESTFDLAVSATAFHWLKSAPALAQIRRALRPGGWWSMWWNIFGDPSDPDLFQQATDALFSKLPRSRSHVRRSDPPFALQVAARQAELSASGFTHLHHRLERWQFIQSTEQVLALTSTFSPVASLPIAERRAFLDQLRQIADEQFNGKVTRTFLTVFYAGQKSAN